MNPTLVPASSPHITAERVQISIRARFNPIPSLTPQLLGNYLESFRLGFFRNIALTWDAMERRDYKIAVVAAKRKKSVARHGWEILTLEDSPAANAQKAALEYFYDHLTATNALEENETGGLSLLVRQMMDAVGKRYAVHEIIWQPVISPENSGADRSPQLTATFRACPLWWFEGTQGRLRFLSTEFALYGDDMAPADWLVTVGDGLMEPTSVAYMFKHLPLRDWLSCSEKFGMPGLIGRTDAAYNSEEWHEFVTALKDFSHDWAAVFNSGASIELVESKASAEGPFAPLVEKMDRAITTLWRGSDLGTMSSHNAAGASLQADESDLLELDDAQLISETLATQVSRHVLQYHFGDAPALAYLKLHAGRNKLVSQDLQVDQFLLQSGAPLSLKDALARYDRTAARPGEAVLKLETPLPLPGSTGSLSVSE